VAKLITMPNTPNFVNSNFSLIRTVGQTISPFTGKTKTQEFDGVYWIAEVSLPPMRRNVALQWQSFLLELNGSINNFKFADPDALINSGSYNATALLSELRVNNTSVTLSFTTSGRITASASTFANAIVGDFIVVTGAVNEENNGTHKITTKTSNTVVVTDGDFTTENSTASCKVRTNVKGATGLSLKASSTSATGTINKGDYLSIQSAANSTGTPSQLVMVTEDATFTNATTDQYSVKTQPKLRSDLASGHFVVFANPKGTFRLISNEVSWSADKISNYGISFSCIEVI
tara:strand:- start:2939 stop:3808 length:870 start_codon:yes stop_codon:yes gene_type:complete